MVAKPMLEVCVDTVRTAVTAFQAGADRLELCAALDVGGVTPCRALIEAVRMEVPCPIVVLVRPRAGHFVYDRADAQQMRATICQSLDLNIQGFVVGGLDAQSSHTRGHIDLELLESLVSLADDSIEWVMHRAFDFTQDPLASLEQLVALGFDRVLTSGGAHGGAITNVTRLRELVRRAAGRITILPGGGINSDNARLILTETGCTQLHGSFRMASGECEPQTRMFGGLPTIDRDAIRFVHDLLVSYKRADGSEGPVCAD